MLHEPAFLIDPTARDAFVRTLIYLSRDDGVRFSSPPWRLPSVFRPQRTPGPRGNPASDRKAGGAA